MDDVVVAGRETMDGLRRVALGGITSAMRLMGSEARGLSREFVEDCADGRVSESFFMFLEWWLPEETLDKVQLHWCRKSFEEVRLVRRFDCGVFDISLPSVTDGRRLGIRWHGVRPPLRCIFSLSPRRYAVRYRLLPAPKVLCTYEVCISVPDIAVAYQLERCSTQNVPNIS